MLTRPGGKELNVLCMFHRLWFKLPTPPFFFFFPLNQREKGQKGTRDMENKSLERLKITKGDSGALWA